MAPLALCAEAAEVSVILGMATEAVSDQTGRDVASLAMAVVTVNLEMGTVQLEPSFRVIEVPGFPGSSVMTGLALDTKAALMPLLLIILFVALVAGGRRIMERWRQVTLLALDLGMASCERET